MSNRVGTRVARVMQLLYGSSRIIVITVLLMMMVNIAANAFGRRLFNTPITGTIELVTYWYMPVLALVGFMIAEQRSEHTQTALVFNLLSPRSQKDLNVFICLVTLCVYLGFAGLGLYQALADTSYGRTGGLLGLIVWPVLYLVPISFTVMSIEVGSKYLKSRRNSVDDKEGVGTS